MVDAIRRTQPIINRACVNTGSNPVLTTKIKIMKKRGRPIGSIKGKTKQPVTVMLRVDEIAQAGGVEAAREKIKNNFSKL